jgi:anti-sigma regulatory factor (Ser/Thr protein kinase)
LSTSTLRGPSRTSDAFRHEALLYAGDREFTTLTTAFVRDALDAGEPVMVVVNADKIDALRVSLGHHADEVYFSDMAEVGRNPARIIPAWRAFVNDIAADGTRVRGVGEPIWPDRTPAELVECQRHESLLNLAFADAPAWWLLCPYDVASLEPSVVEEAHRNHPYIMRGGTQHESRAYLPDGGLGAFDDFLPEPMVPPFVQQFAHGDLEHVRDTVSRRGRGAGLSERQASDLVLAVNELTTNSLRYGGGEGTLRMWQEPGALVCEVRDRGHIDEPLAGRSLPPTHEDGGRGLWLVNQLTDLAQLRSSPSGTVIRLHTWLSADA